MELVLISHSVYRRRLFLHYLYIVASTLILGSLFPASYSGKPRKLLEVYFDIVGDSIWMYGLFALIGVLFLVLFVVSLKRDFFKVGSLVILSNKKGIELKGKIYPYTEISDLTIKPDYSKSSLELEGLCWFIKFKYMNKLYRFNFVLRRDAYNELEHLLPKGILKSLSSSSARL